MFIVSNAASSAVSSAVPALTRAATANPITATVLTVGAVGLAAWKGTELAVTAAPLFRSLVSTIHDWTAPEVVTEAAKEAAANLKAAQTLTSLEKAAQAAIKAAEDATAVAVAATRRAEEAAAAAHSSVFEGVLPGGRAPLNGHAA